MFFQTEWMKTLMARYGNDVTCLDATYKTSRYCLPLYFLAVRTNIDYHVGVFIPEDETVCSPHKALEILMKAESRLVSRFCHDR